MTAKGINLATTFGLSTYCYTYPHDTLYTNKSYRIVVAEVSHQSDGSEGSLASSSVIMMPQSAASARSTAPSDAVGLHQALSLTRDSSLTAGSKPSIDDTASDNGSIGSSVSLISVPSSEDEDSVDWQDSRSHAEPTPPQSARDAADYEILYDTSSDEE